MEKIKKKANKAEEINKEQYNLMLEFFEMNEISPKQAMNLCLSFMMNTMKLLKMTPEEVVIMFGLLSKAYAEGEF